MFENVRACVSVCLCACMCVGVSICVMGGDIDFKATGEDKLSLSITAVQDVIFKSSIGADIFATFLVSISFFEKSACSVCKCIIF